MSSTIYAEGLQVRAAESSDGHHGDGRYGQERVLPRGHAAREGDRYPHDGDGRYVRERPFPTGQDRPDRGFGSGTRLAINETADR